MTKATSLAHTVGGNDIPLIPCFEIHGYPQWWAEMKAARAKRGGGASRGGGGANRGWTAVAVGEHATYAENLKAGSVAAPATTNGGDENKAVASVSVAKEWIEAKIFTANGTTAGLSTTIGANFRGTGGARVSAGERVTAQVSPNLGLFGINNPKFDKSKTLQIRPNDKLLPNSSPTFHAEIPLIPLLVHLLLYQIPKIHNGYLIVELLIQCRSMPLIF